MNFSKRLVATAAVGALALGVLVGPASAHTRNISQVYTANWEGGGGVNVQAWLKPMEKHPGTMKLTLKKKNAEGDWVVIGRATGKYQIGWGYTHTFDPVAGQKTCKALAKFTSDGHPNVSKASDPFKC